MRTLPRCLMKQEEIDENTLSPETSLRFILGTEQGIWWIRVKISMGKNS